MTINKKLNNCINVSAKLATATQSHTQHSVSAAAEPSMRTSTALNLLRLLLRAD